jgi:hypothetical protein
VADCTGEEARPEELTELEPVSGALVLLELLVDEPLRVE